MALECILIGSLLAVLTIDRLAHIVSLIPWIFDYLFYFVFPKKDDPSLNSKEYKKIFKIEPENYPLIPSCLDDSLTELIENIFTSYVIPISENLGLSYDVHVEFRKVVRKFVSSIYVRASSMNLDNFMQFIIIPKTIEHLLICKKACNIMEGTKEPLPEKVIFKRLFSPTHIHSGVLLEGKDTNSYITALSEGILNITLSDIETYSRPTILLLRSFLATYLLLPIIDYFSSPVNLNYLISCTLNSYNQHSIALKEDTAILVPILSKFFSLDSSKYLKIETPPRAFMLSWKQLQSNSSLLYIFMQVSKRSPSFKYPHFCMYIETFVKKIINFEAESNVLSPKMLKELLSDGISIFQTFIAPTAYELIDLPEDIYQKLIEFDFELETLDNVELLSSYFNVAYQFVFDLLQPFSLDTFYRTPEFFMLCVGDRPKMQNQISTFHKSRSKQEYNMCHANLSEEGRDRLDDEDSLHTPLDFLTLLSDDERLSDAASTESVSTDHTVDNNDVSNWTVEIKSLKNAWKKNSKIVQFIIIVHNPSAIKDTPNRWEVARQYKEFYGLENRLKRFHGGRITVSLPPKRSMLYKTYEFFTTCKLPFQEFIQSLLKIPFLKHSSLLYAFLTKNNFDSNSYFGKTISIDTGRALQSVIGTLSTEKGKYIDNFINSFAFSTEYTRQKLSTKRTMAQLKQKYSFLTEPTPSSIIVGSSRTWKHYEGNPRLLKQIFKASYLIFQPIKLVGVILHILYTLLGGISEIIMARWFTEEVKRSITPVSISYVIDCLNSYLTSNKEKMRPEISSLELTELLFKQFKISSFIMNETSMKNCIKSFVDLFQLRLFNRQLIFTILDDMFSILLPELTQLKQQQTFS